MMMNREINSRDLFYSNPADRFLNNDPKTSVESGFSSSFGHSLGGNSKEFLNTTSEDLFNLTPKISGCEGQTSKTDYQKYISQSLFIKKGKTPRKFSFGRNENQWNDEEKLPPKKTENQNDFDEIKAICGSSLEGLKKLNTDVSEVKQSIKGMGFEISKQNERMESFEEIFYKQQKIMEEFNENCKMLNRRDDDNLTKLQKTLNQNIKEIKNAVDKVKSAMETNQTSILENIKKNSAPQPNMNKKLSEQAKRQNEQLIRNIDIKINHMQNALDIHLTDIKNYYEEKLHENIDDLKVLINSSNSKLREMISSQKVNELKTGSYRNYTGTAQQNASKTYESERSDFFNRQQSVRSIPNPNSNYGWRNDTHFSYQNSARSSAHMSPLANIFNRNNRISQAERNRNGQDESPFTMKKAERSLSPSPPPPKRQLPRACKQNFPQKRNHWETKRKISTPILQTNQRMKKNQKKPAVMNTSFSGNIVNAYKTPPMRSGQLRVNTTKAETTMSSPYLNLTLYGSTNDFTFI